MKTKIIPLIFLLVGIFVFTENSQAATTYYVATTGNDTNAGTQTASFKTIQKAADIVNPGDTVIVRAGTYASFAIRRSGTVNSYITFKPYQGEIVIIDGHLSSRYNCIDIIGSSYVEINGFTLTDSNSLYNSSVFVNYSQGLDHNGIKLSRSGIIDPHHITLAGLTIYHTGMHGIYTSYYSSYVTIKNNMIYQAGRCKRGYGMYLGGNYHVISGNTVHDNYGHGIHIYVEGTGVTASYNLVDSNLVYNNGSFDYAAGYDTAFSSSSGTGIVVSGNGGNNTVINNICYGNVHHGISSNQILNSVINNTTYHNRRNGIYIYVNKSNIIRNNIVYLNQGLDGYAGEYFIGSGNTQDHNLFGIDPKFVNLTNKDFHLQSTSPAIAKGLLTGAPTYDFDGVARGSIIDIGAYEYVVGDTTSPAIPKGLMVN